MFWWKGNMVRKEDALVQNTKSNAIPYFASFWLSVSPFISLRFHFSFIRGRSQHQPLGCWEILMRCCMWKSFENYNTAAAAADDNNKVSWHLLRAYHERAPSVQFSSVAQSCPTLQFHGLQHTRPPCPSPTPRVYSNSCLLSWWCHPTISSSVVPFFSHLQSFPASGSFQMSQLFTSGCQSIGVSALTSVLPMNIQDWFPLGSVYQFSWVQSLSRVQLFATPWIAARQASLSITNSRRSLKLRSIKSVMPWVWIFQ